MNKLSKSHFERITQNIGAELTEKGVVVTDTRMSALQTVINNYLESECNTKIVDDQIKPSGFEVSASTLYRVDAPLEAEKGFTWVGSKLFDQLVYECDEMNSYFTTDCLAKASEAIRIINLFNQIKIDTNKSKFENKDDIEDFEVIVLQSALVFDKERGKCPLNQLLELKEHMKIPAELLEIIEQKA